MQRFDPAKLVFCLRRLGWTQRRLAEALGRGQTDLSAMVNGWRPVPDGVVEAAAKELGVSVEAIAVDEGDDTGGEGGARHGR